MHDSHVLSPGTMLDRYKIIRVLGEGGFGITYLAEDLKSDMQLAIKEYFPNEFVVRSNDATIKAKSKSVGDFNKGIQRFKEEAETLKKFDHPSIVKVFGYFETNNTAYFVMDYEEGMDISKYLKGKDKPLSQDEVVGIMMPILEGLKEIHSYNYLHRDVKPGNILLRPNKSPVIIDFGAARIAVNDEQSVSVTSMLTDGYAPFEQYSTNMKQQGPFTDIYGAAAVMYKMITLETPISSQTRSYQLLQSDNDPLVKLSMMNLKGYEPHFLKAIDKALEIKANNRQQTVDEFQAELFDSRSAESQNIKFIPSIIKKLYKNPTVFLILSIAVLYSLYLGINQFNIFLEKKGLQEAELSRYTLEINNNIWQDMPDNKVKKLNWEEAVSYCVDLTLGGHDDWRLPTVDELKELHVRETGFRYMTYDFYWASSLGGLDGHSALYVYSKDGKDFFGDKSSKFYARCIHKK